MRLARETWLLLAVGLADLTSTIYLVRHGLVREANPVMAWYLVHFGMWAFCAAKATMLVCPLVILEWARQVQPYLGRWALRVALIGYIVLYLSIVWQVNEVHFQRLLGHHLSGAGRFTRTTPSIPTQITARQPMTMPMD